ncbi:hypothetical protein C7B80_03890 [Cyanosarcina cf. burmensis CCALA 770]|nr:hypothetical protein C7B80_03890 [Cyanosarcina cf. burmensis CCALA 770]
MISMFPPFGCVLANVNSTSSHSGFDEYFHKVHHDVQYDSYKLFPVKKKFTFFGAEATKQLNYVDCYPQGQNAQPQACLAAGIEGFPTWEINRQIAQMSGYQSP